MLVKLEAKGVIRHRAEGLRYVYSPVASKSSAQKRAVSQLLNVFFGGSPSQAAKALLKQEGWSDDELEALRAEIETARKNRRKSYPHSCRIALPLSQSIEVSILVKATVWLLVGLTAVALTGSARASVRHLILAATFAALPQRRLS